MHHQPQPQSPKTSGLLGLVAGLFAILIHPVGVFAGGLEVWPVNIKLPATGHAQQVVVRNPSNEQIYVQVAVVEWHELGQLKSAAPADEILAMPPVFELEPAGAQVVRVAMRKPLEDNRELAFRLIVTEVPRTLGLLPNTLAIAKRMNLPIFVTPENAQPKPIWTLTSAADGRSMLRLANEGDAHIRIESVSLIEGTSQKPAFETQRIATVLPGKVESWPLEIGLAAIQEPLFVRADSNVGPIEAIIELPGR